MKLPSGIIASTWPDILRMKPRFKKELDELLGFAAWECDDADAGPRTRAVWTSF